MREFAGRTAFVTGAASGIGLGMARVFARHGMKVMLADVEQPALDEAVAALKADGGEVAGVEVNVGDRASVEAAAQATLAAFGKVHLVCNNAGVVVAGRTGRVPPQDWDWIIDVNLMGVVRGTETFLPHLLAHGEGGHIVNTSSIGGLISAGAFEPYGATKHAVMALSEGWRQQLAPRGIGVSVLCPGFVRSKMDSSARNHPNRDPARPVKASKPDQTSGYLEDGMAPELVGERVLEAVAADELYIFTHSEFEPLVRQRFERMLAAFAPLEGNPDVAGLHGAVSTDSLRLK